MRTPTGQECRYFYGDYHRGRNHEECRLLKNTRHAQAWKPDLCATCPVPEILRANSCEYMTLNAIVYRPFFIFKPRVRVTAYCTKTQQAVAEPHVGCGEYHKLPDVFSE
ncbi:MAG: hypothetical protein U9O54_01845 [Chloroflexota bacterium]|nr:hypothetical protein [Chloroflexota bacterium]